MLTNTSTKVRTKQGEGENAEYRITSGEAFDKQVKKAAASNGAIEAPSLVARQDFISKKAETLAELVELCGGDEALALVHANYGISLAQHNEANDLLAEDGFQSQEDPIDVSYVLAQRTEGRRKQSNEEKAAKLLGFSPEMIKQALAMLAAQKAGGEQEVETEATEA